MKIISKTIFLSRSLKSVATNSLLQESLACVDTTLPFLYCVNRDVCRRVCVCLYIYRCPCATTHCEPNTAPPFFLSLSLFLLHHSTPPEAKPAFLFIRLSLLVFFTPSFFLPTPLPCFSTFFCSSGGGSKTRKAADCECQGLR